MDASLLVSRLSRHGFLGSIKVAANFIFHTVRDSILYSPDDFDRRYGTDTARAVRLWRLKILSPNAACAVHYATSPESTIRKAIEMARINRRDFTFLDLGCGKGKPLIIASVMGFKCVVGVDFSPELVKKARENLKRCRAQAQVFCADVTEFPLPDGPLCVYLYNPFGAGVMSKVVARLAAHPFPVWIVYLNAIHFDCINAAGFTLAPSDDHVFVWHHGNVRNF